jgi:phage tail-like protein
MALVNAVGLRVDPVLAYNFLITFVESSSVLATAVSGIRNVALGGFSECSGLEMNMQPEEYREGGRNDAVLKFPNRITWSNLTLKRGMTFDTDLWDWHYSFVEGRGRRRDGIIVLQNELHLPVNIWYFKCGLPVKWTGPTMNASQNNVAVETLEIAHEGLRQVALGALGISGVGLGAAGVAVGANAVLGG